MESTSTGHWRGWSWWTGRLLAPGILVLALGAPWSAASSAAAFLGEQADEGVSVLGFAPIAEVDHGVEIGVLALPMRPVRGEQAWLAVVVEIDGPSLLRGDESEHAVEAELVVQAFDAHDAVVDTTVESLRFARGEASNRLRATGAKVLTGIMLGAGSYRVRALVRNPATDRKGSAETVIALPSAAPVLLPPMVPEQAEPWIVVHGRRPEYGGAVPSRPFFVRDRTFVPAVAPQAQAGATVPLVLMGYGLAGAEDELDAELIGPDGAAIDGVRLVLSPAQAARDGIDRILAALPLPASLPAGDYTLRLTAFDDAPDGGASSESVFHLGTSAGHALLSVNMPRLPAGASAAASLDAAQEAVGPKIAVKEIAARYRALLTRLGAADRDELVGELAALELAGARGDRENGVGRVENAEMPVLWAIADGDPEALVPVLKLHHDLAIEHRRQRHAYLMRNAIDTLLAVAERYAPAGGAIGKRIVVARVLSSLAGHFQVSGGGFDRMLFEEALRYDPVHASALLGLAASPEKRGGPYTEAVYYLERLVRAHANNREGRLRLAINLLRAGTALEVTRATLRAERHLERLVRGPEADWIYVLAVQELARLLRDEGDLNAALILLETATRRAPENQKLKIEYAYYLDRDGKSTEAQRVLLALEADRTGLAPARGRYNQWPRQALAIDRRLLDAGVEQRRTLLVQLAQATPAGKGRR